MNIIASFDYVNKTEGHRIGSDEPLETRFSTKGELYKHCLREYGRCVGKMYIDSRNGAKQIGWVFEKLARYTDVNEKYLQETWVTVHDKMPEVKHEVTYHYADF